MIESNAGKTVAISIHVCMNTNTTICFHRIRVSSVVNRCCVSLTELASCQTVCIGSDPKGNERPSNRSMLPRGDQPCSYQLAGTDLDAILGGSRNGALTSQSLGYASRVTTLRLVESLPPDVAHGFSPSGRSIAKLGSLLSWPILCKFPERTSARCGILRSVDSPRLLW